MSDAGQAHAAPLQLTGERTAPGHARENYWFRRHEVAYAWLAHRWRGLGGVVVDAGSGEGYGAEMLRSGLGSQVLALEFDQAAAIHAAASYPHVATLRANLDALPLASGTVDLVVSMQVIEHLWDLGRFIAECRRVLRPDGIVVLATPNRLTFSPGLARGEKPTNPFHVEEFDASQVHGMLQAAGFGDIELWGLHHGPGIAEDLVPRQVEAALADEWPLGLVAEVGAVTTADFVIRADGIDESLDLIGIGRAPRSA